MNLKRIELLEQYIREDPSDSFSRYALALEWAAEDQDKAVALLLAVIKDNPQYVPAYYQAAVLLLEQNRIEETKIVVAEGIKMAAQQNDHKTIKELRQLQGELD
jgi:tetratricopeptide (TPR) repeat protein